MHEILNVSFTKYLDGMNEATASSEIQSFIKSLQIPIPKKTGKILKEMGIHISIKGYVEILSKTRESAASSPSGIHYGHYIAACESELLTTVNLIHMTTPFHVGIPLTR